MDCSIGEETSRNGVTNVGSSQHCEQRKETATSIEVNKRIRDEYNQGFRNLSNAAQQFAQQSVELLVEKGLNPRRNWLRKIAAHREYQKNFEEKE